MGLDIFTSPSPSTEDHNNPLIADHLRTFQGEMSVVIPATRKRPWTRRLLAIRLVFKIAGSVLILRQGCM